MTLRAIAATPGGEAAARLEHLGSAAARADPAKQDQPAILARALDRHDDARHHEGRDQYEVRNRDEQTAQRERPAHPQSRERPAESLRRCLLDDDGRHPARRKAECCERRLSLNLDHHLPLSTRRKQPRPVHGSRAEPLRDEAAPPPRLATRRAEPGSCRISSHLPWPGLFPPWSAPFYRAPQT